MEQHPQQQEQTHKCHLPDKGTLVLIVIICVLVLLLGAEFFSPNTYKCKPPSDNHWRLEDCAVVNGVVVTFTPAPTAAAPPTMSPIGMKLQALERRIKTQLNLGRNTKVTEVSTDTDIDPATNKELQGKVAVVIMYQMDGTNLYQIR